MRTRETEIQEFRRHASTIATATIEDELRQLKRDEVSRPVPLLKRTSSFMARAVARMVAAPGKLASGSFASKQNSSAPANVCYVDQG